MGAPYDWIANSCTFAIIDKYDFFAKIEKFSLQVNRLNSIKFFTMSYIFIELIIIFPEGLGYV